MDAPNMTPLPATATATALKITHGEHAIIGDFIASRLKDDLYWSLARIGIEGPDVQVTSIGAEHRFDTLSDAIACAEEITERECRDAVAARQRLANADARRHDRVRLCISIETSVAAWMDGETLQAPTAEQIAWHITGALQQVLRLADGGSMLELTSLTATLSTI